MLMLEFIARILVGVLVTRLWKFLIHWNTVVKTRIC